MRAEHAAAEVGQRGQAAAAGDAAGEDDIGLQNAVARHYNDGERLAISDLRAIAEAWAPWRSVATLYLWRSLDPIAVEY